MLPKTSIVIPAKNESEGLRKLLPELFRLYPDLLEVIVVNDGSTDDTEKVSLDFGAVVVNHKYSRGNGASIKSGTRKSKGEYICFMDADGQHKPESVSRLLVKLEEGFDMVVGERASVSQANKGRLIANKLYNYFASLIANYPVKDLTSGLRCVKSEKFREFLHLLPNGFSYPTTITMVFLRTGYQIEYLLEDVSSDRLGKSHISPLKDGLKFLIILFKIGTLYSPLKVFSSISALLFLVAFGYYIFTFLTDNTLTNMSVILFTSSLIIFLIGLVSEQINSLMYMKKED